MARWLGGLIDWFSPAQFIVSFIGATLENPRIIVTEFMARGSLLNILRDTSIDLPTPLRLQMALDMALGLRAGRGTMGVLHNQIPQHAQVN